MAEKGNQGKMPTTGVDDAVTTLEKEAVVQEQKSGSTAPSNHDWMREAKKLRVWCFVFQVEWLVFVGFLCVMVVMVVVVVCVPVDVSIFASQEKRVGGAWGNGL